MISFISADLTKIKWALRYLLLGLLGLGCSVLLLNAVCNPLLRYYRPQLEALASNYLHVAVQVKSLKLSWYKFTPALTLSEVTLLSTQTAQPLLTVNAIKVSIAILQSLWQHQLKLNNVNIAKVNLAVVTDGAGSISVNDWPIQDHNSSSAENSGSQALAWLALIPSINLYDLHIKFNIQQHMHEVIIRKFKLRNDATQHTLRATLAIEPNTTDNIKLNMAWDGENFDYQHTTGQAELQFSHLLLADFFALKTQLFPTLGGTGWSIVHGESEGEIWFNWNNASLQAIKTKIYLQNLAVHSVVSSTNYLVPYLTGEFGWQRQGLQEIIQGDKVRVNFAGHLWPVANFNLVFDRHFAQNTNSWRLKELQISYLDLKDSSKILLATQLLSPQMRFWLNNLNLDGELRHLQFLWQNDFDDWRHIVSSGAARNLKWHNYDQVPGVSNLSGTWLWSGTSGKFAVASQELNVVADPYWHAINFAVAQGKFLIQHQEDRWAIAADNVLLGNQDLNANFKFNLLIPKAQAPLVDLKVNFKVAQLKRLVTYFPSKMLPEKLHTWLTDAFLSGKVTAGQARLQGPINELWRKNNTAHTAPEQKLALLLTASLKDLALRYNNDWPTLDIADSTVTITRDKLSFNVVQGQTLNLPLQDFSGEIDFGVKASPILNITGKIKHDFTHALDFLRHTPLVQTITNYGVSSAKLHGPFNLALSLRMPISAPFRVHVVGLLHTNNASLVLPNANFKLEKIQGNISLTEHNLNAANLTGKLWDQDIKLNVFTTPNPQQNLENIKAILTGKINIAHISKLFALDLNNILSGTINYQIIGKFTNHADSVLNSSLVLTSDLKGIKINLPMPYGKSAHQTRDFAIKLDVKPHMPYNFTIKYGDLFNPKLRWSTGARLNTIEIISQPVEGKITFPYPWNKNDLLNISLYKLALTNFFPDTSGQTSGLLPQNLPPVAVQIDNFSYNSYAFGQLRLASVPMQDGLKINTLELSAPDYNFTAHGVWQISNDKHYSTLAGKIVSHNIKTLAQRVNLAIANLLVSNGHAEFNFSWSDPIYKPSLAGITGNLSLYLEKGRVINLTQQDNQKMDLGKMLNLFSLQTIPRRLGLDFSDLFEKGYSFDFIKSDLILRHGTAYTNKNIVLEGPIAKIKAHGSVGLIAQDYNLVLSIEPQLTDSLPVVAGAITLNPLVGAATWLVNKVVLNKQLSKVITYNYLITGPWSNPSWQELKR